MEKTIYLAGPLFETAHRHRNILLAYALKALGYRMILPQDEALKFFDGKSFDLIGICEGCLKDATTSDVVVANLDGPDTDSGTAFEVGAAILSARLNRKLGRNKPLVICVRTDFRTASDKEVGINAMFRLSDKIIEKPAYVNSLEEVEKFYKELAQEIHEYILSRLG
ncbi:MAG: nucleoside 2-deoxyribosyltransferase [Candidatus Omnitrophota bacterium]